MSKKKVALLMALVLVLGASIGGTLAWLQTKTATVTNTFVVGDIGTLTLTETDKSNISVTEGSDPAKHTDFVVVPGVKITKDPAVTYIANETTGDKDNDVPVYVFVKIAPASKNWAVTGNTSYAYNIPATGDVAKCDNALTFTVDTATWTPLSGEEGVFYKEMAADQDLSDKAVITGDTINVSTEITKEQLRSLTAADMDLVFSAYAIQKDGHANVNAAWTAVSGN